MRQEKTSVCKERIPGRWFAAFWRICEKVRNIGRELGEKNVKNQKVDSTFSDLKTESKSAFIESLKAFQAQNPNFLSNIVNKELSRKYWAYGIIA